VHIIETCGGVAAAAQGFNPAIEFPWTKTSASFEHHVFEEVSHTFLAAFLPGTSTPTPEVKAGEGRIGDGGRYKAAAVAESAVVEHRTGWDRSQGPVAKSHSVQLRIGLMPASPSGQEMHPLVTALAARIRQCRDGLPELTPLVLSGDLEEIIGTLDGEALFINNEVHRCRGLRKLHLEIARLGLGLQILHCVFFPDPRFDLPVFGADIVASPAGISAAIIDLSPVGDQLPERIEQGLQATVIPAFEQVRELPTWATIFSPFVRFIRPVNQEEEDWFVDLVDDYLRVLADAVQASEPDEPSAPSTLARYQGQVSYCRQQKRNDKTRRVLEKAFGTVWADRYIEELLFDEPQSP
jgi:phycocyanobilin:ferredoxin oxidoreductase